MGKFDPKLIEQKAQQIERKRQSQIKRALKRKELLKIIPKGADFDTVEDAVLLFGKHRGEKISDLFSSYSTSSYVVHFLAQSETIPKPTRDMVQAIIQNFNPFSSGVGNKDFTPLDIIDLDDIPF